MWGNRGVRTRLIASRPQSSAGAVGGVLTRALHRPRRVDLINRCVGLNESQSLAGREGLAMALCERRGVESFHVASDLLQSFHAACIRGVGHGAPFERLVPARGRHLYGTGVVRRPSIDRLGRRWRGCRRKFDIASSAGLRARARAERARAQAACMRPRYAVYGIKRSLIPSGRRQKGQRESSWTRAQGRSLISRSANARAPSSASWVGERI